MDTRLSSLSRDTLPYIQDFLSKLVEARIPVVIVNTARTQAEQDEAVKTGHSWVQRSKHQDGKAIDICPLQVYDVHGPDKLLWDTADPVWQKIGAIGESCGLIWGGKWTVKDMGHFELPGK